MKFHHKNIFLFLILSVITTSGLPSQVIAQGLTPEDIADIKTVGSVTMSPDGNYIAYTLSVPREAEEEVGGNYSELYIIPADGGERRSVIKKPMSAGSPEWGRDGRLYFMARIAEHHSQTQVYSVNRSGNSLRRHSNARNGLSSYSWSDDGTYLAYTALDPLPQEVRESQNRGYDMIVEGENPRYMRLWVRARGEEADVISPEELYIWDYEWAPGGDQLAVRMSDKPGADQEQMYTRIGVIERDGSDLIEIMTSPKKKGSMSWSPDASRIAVLAGMVYSDPLPQRIWILNSDGSDKHDYTPDYWEGTPEWIDWLDDQTILFTAVERSSTSLNRMHTDDGDVNRIAGGDEEIFRSISTDREKQTFAASANRHDHPGEVYSGTLQNEELTRLTYHNSWLEERELGDQSSISWPGADGWEIEGVLTKPVGYQEGTLYPLVILPHGGPEGISMNGWNTRPLYPVQVLAAEGYNVFKPNYRGSGGRGTAFASANQRDLGGKEFDDVLLGIDYLSDAGLIDPDRVGISGTSYGGYFSAWAATRHSDRFAAGITFAGLSNWISFMGTTDIPHEMSVVHWDLYWFDNPGQNWERSPVAWLQQADTPLLVVHGLADDRVHPEQSIQLHQFLQMKEIPTRLVLYPRQPHGLTERAHRIDFMERVLDWFGEFLD